jgi:hypothetical protein
VNTGRKETVMISSEKNSAGPTSRDSGDDGLGALGVRMVFLEPLDVLVRVLDHDDGRIDHGADGDRDAAQAHDVRVHAQRAHGDEGDQHAHRQHQDRHQCATRVHQEHQADQGDDDAFLDQRGLQRGDGALDQLGAVVDRGDTDAGRQARRDLGQLLLDVADHLQRVLAVAGRGDAGDNLALAVEFGDAAPLVRPEFDARDVANQHRRAALGLHHQVFDVGLAAQVAAAAHHVLGLGHLHRTAADVAVGIADCLHHFHQRHAVRTQLDRIDHHLVLLDEAADAGHLGHARRLGQLVADEPVLQRAQFRQRCVLGQHHVLVHPADTGGVWPQLRRDTARQAAGGEVQVLQHPRARPVDVGAVLEDHIDERGAEEGKAAHHFRLRHREHGGGQRIGDLVLDHLRRLARSLGVDDHLHIGEVGQRVERRLPHRMHPGQRDEQGQDHNEELVACRPVDEGVQHLNAPCAPLPARRPLPPRPSRPSS